MSKTRSITITLDDGKSPPPDTPKDALTAGAEAIEAAVRVKQDVKDAAVEAARKDLEPTVAEAARALAEIQRLQTEYGEKLRRLTTTNWTALRLRRVPGEFIDPLHRHVNDVLGLLASAQRDLAAVPARVAALKPEDLALRNYKPRPFQAGGLHPEGPTRIRETVHLYVSAPEVVRERVETIKGLLAEITKRVESNTGNPPGQAIKIVRPEDEDLMRKPADGPARAFDPFTYDLAQGG